jgi:hypothetical protein
MRRWLLALALVAVPTAEVSAEWHVKPFLGVTFAGRTTLVGDVEEAAGKKHTAVGASVLLIGDIVGVEADFGYVPGFFEANQGLVLRSSALSLMGNVVVAMPRRIAEYTLRPYVLGGLGLLRAQTEDVLDALPVSEKMPAFNIGGGVTGFLTERVGVSWDLRYFRSIGGPETPTGTSIGKPQLSFWRANMALTLRY